MKSKLLLSALVLSGASFAAQAQDQAYIVGNFNDYNPDGNVAWALSPEEGVDGMYKGTFDIPAGDVDFYISRFGGRMVLVPGEVSDGTVEVAQEDATVVFDDGFYDGCLAQTTFSDYKWVIKDWEGGELEVTVDIDNNSLILSVVASAQPDDPDAAMLYLSGNFNDYAFSGETWQLSLVEGTDDVYRGTFDIAAGDVDFFISRNGGRLALVPGEMIDGEVSPLNADYEVELDEGFYEGYFGQTSLGNSKWVLNNWNGGELEVTVDYYNSTISLSAAGESQPEVQSDLFISGNFNDYAISGETWQLTLVDGADDIYRGTFDIPAGNVDFVVSRMGGRMKLVPGVAIDGMVSPAEDSVEVVFDEGFYSGPLAMTSLGNATWVISNWKGGALEITVDFGNEEIMVS